MLGSLSGSPATTPRGKVGRGRAPGPSAPGGSVVVVVVVVVAGEPAAWSSSRLTQIRAAAPATTITASPVSVVRFFIVVSFRWRRGSAAVAASLHVVRRIDAARRGVIHDALASGDHD